MEETPIAVQVQNLTKKYPNASDAVESLKEISFNVSLGKICCLLGPNGSGKTTLLKTLAGLLAPTSGALSIMGIDPLQDPKRVQSLIGWMPAEERSGFYGRLTGRQNLKFFGSLHGLTSPEMDRVIGNLAILLGLNDDLDKTMLTVSGGTKQKIGLARTLLHNPTILLLDEPMRNLDPHTLVRFRRLLRDHLTLQQKKTVILSTHQLDEAKRVADIIIILQNGQIVRSLEARELEKELMHTSVEEFYLKTIDSRNKE